MLNKGNVVVQKLLKDTFNKRLRREGVYTSDCQGMVATPHAPVPGAAEGLRLIAAAGAFPPGVCPPAEGSK